MRRIFRIKISAKWLTGIEVRPAAILGDALSMTLMVATAALATLAYGM